MAFITISVQCPSELSDLIIAELFEIGFDSFQEFEEGFDGSCDEAEFSEEQVKEILDKYEQVSFSIREQEKINWNEEWEKNYEPIIVDDKCLVRASFHESLPSYEYEIIVTPKMSFGTGHHATTYLMLSHQMELDHTNADVLDVGTGTGILAIMAAKRGANKIVATDIDEWCIENSRENFSLNHLSDIGLIHGQIDLVEGLYDIVIANINKNVLIEQMEEYAKRLKPNRHLLLSGFYQEDIKDLEVEAEKSGLKLVNKANKDNWAMMVLIKQFV